MTGTILTPEGKKQLEEKLEFLKTVRRPEVSKKIGIAREFGDLSENAEYDAAKEEQAQVEAEIMDLENKLRSSVVINQKKIDTSSVNIGCKVKVFDEAFNEEVEYQIVGSTESNPRMGLISNESPVGAALLGKKKGDRVEVVLPDHSYFLKIVSITA